MAIFRIVIFSSILCIITTGYAYRSIHRPEDPLIPKISTYWTDTPQGLHYSLKSPCLEEWAIFGRYNKKILEAHTLPPHITYRYEPEKSVERSVLNTLIEELIAELFALQVKPNKQPFKNFVILKDRNFNYKMHAGLIILKFKNYPFVVKLFMENPESFTKPFNKGIEMGFAFAIGGPGRFNIGFTRIPNLQILRNKVTNNPLWSQRIVFPRKWYWLPHDVRSFTIIGKNIGNQYPVQKLELPSIYAIICDEMRMERPLRTYHKEDRVTVREILKVLDNALDPHINNFFIEEGTGKIAIIDTEHFPSLMAFKEPIEFKSNTHWYTSLANKCVKDLMFRTKKTRKELQSRLTPNILIIDPDSNA